MAFIAGALIVGGVIITHSDYSDYRDYSDHRNHSNHRQYGDAGMVSAVNDKQNQVNRLASDVGRQSNEMQSNFDARIRSLRDEKNYSALSNAKPSNVVEAVKDDMRRELDASIAQERAALEKIDKMIARINELELNAERSG